MEQIIKLYNKLQDEESRKLFELKLKMGLTGNYVDFIDGLINLNKKWEISAYDDCIENCAGKEVIIWGAGIDGKMTQHLLEQRGVHVSYFCDNAKEKQNKTYCGIPVISAGELKSCHREAYVILASKNYAPLFYRSLIDSYFPRENIWYPRIGSLYATNGKQYFDCPGMHREKEEVFIDCGCFDGETDKQFVQWSEGEYKKIIAFEPDFRSYESAKKNCANIKNFEIYQCATGKKVGQEFFNMRSSGGSTLDKNGGDIVSVESIDHVMQGQKATFIKMDVEGAELDTLIGAQETIKKYKPKLAISIYHKPEDIYLIPEFIMKCREDYSFLIRHYTSCTFETILYAI